MTHTAELAAVSLIFPFAHSPEPVEVYFNRPVNDYELNLNIDAIVDEHGVSRPEDMKAPIMVFHHYSDGQTKLDQLPFYCTDD